MKKLSAKRTFLIVFLLILFLQLVRPEKNKQNAAAVTDIAHTVRLPDIVKRILQTSCYDCHSNNTEYPWYAQISPISIWLASHVRKGKEELNFTEFALLSPRRMRSKLSSIAEQVNKREMPLRSYTLVHRNAKLSDAQIRLIVDWTEAAKLELRHK